MDDVGGVSESKEGDSGVTFKDIDFSESIMMPIGHGSHGSHMNISTSNRRIQSLIDNMPNRVRRVGESPTGEICDIHRLVHPKTGLMFNDFIGNSQLSVLVGATNMISITSPKPFTQKIKNVLEYIWEDDADPEKLKFEFDKIALDGIPDLIDYFAEHDISPEVGELISNLNMLLTGDTEDIITHAKYYGINPCRYKENASSNAFMIQIVTSCLRLHPNIELDKIRQLLRLNTILDADYRLYKFGVGSIYFDRVRSDGEPHGKIVGDKQKIIFDLCQIVDHVPEDELQFVKNVEKYCDSVFRSIPLLFEPGVLESLRSLCVPELLIFFETSAYDEFKERHFRTILNSNCTCTITSLFEPFITEVVFPTRDNESTKPLVWKESNISPGVLDCLTVLDELTTPKSHDMQCSDYVFINIKGVRENFKLRERNDSDDDGVKGVVEMVAICKMIIDEFERHLKHASKTVGKMREIAHYVLNKIYTGGNVTRTDNMLLSWCLGFEKTILLDANCQEENMTVIEDGKFKTYMAYGNTVQDVIHTPRVRDANKGGMKTTRRYKKTTRRRNKTMRKRRRKQLRKIDN